MNKYSVFLILIVLSFLTACTLTPEQSSALGSWNLLSDKRALSVLGPERLKVMNLSVREAVMAEHILQDHLEVDKSFQSQKIYFPRESGEKLEVYLTTGDIYESEGTVGVECRKLKLAVIQGDEKLQGHDIVCFDSIEKNPSWKRREAR